MADFVVLGLVPGARRIGRGRGAIWLLPADFVVRRAGVSVYRLLRQRREQRELARRQAFKAMAEVRRKAAELLPKL